MRRGPAGVAGKADRVARSWGLHQHGPPLQAVGDLADGRDRTRWFPALVSNHVVDLVNKYPREDLPEELTTYVRTREGYDYLHHAEVGSDNAAFVTDEIVDRFCIIGPPEEHIKRIEELRELGVDQFAVYLQHDDKEHTLASYADQVMPAVNTPTDARTT